VRAVKKLDRRMPDNPGGKNDGFGHAVGEAPGESDIPGKSALAQGADPVHRPLADDAEANSSSRGLHETKCDPSSGD
jgi:hypothetical protein